jgi:glycosyltransferase involved in cell wall biosynthesis
MKDLQTRDTRLTVGMPVFNAEATIRKAIQTILNQSIDDFILIISDNASTDNTYSICREYAEIDARVRLFKQRLNIGPVKNFEFVYRESSSPYFVWAAADDVRTRDYFEVNIKLLQKNLVAAMAGSPNLHTNKSKSIQSFSIKGDRIDRLSKFFKYAFKSNGVFYSIYRSSALSDFDFEMANILGFDWAVQLHVLGQGEYHRSELGLLSLGTSGESQQKDVWKKWRTRKMQWFFPLQDISLLGWRMIDDAKFVEKLKVMRYLAKVNFLAALDQLRQELMMTFQKIFKISLKWPT